MNNEKLNKLSVLAPLKTGLVLLEIGRAVDGIVLGLTVVLGMIISVDGLPSLDKLIGGFLLGATLLMSMNTYNDVKDVEIDKISKPFRPIPRGAITEKTAFVGSIIELVFGICLAFYLNVNVLLTAAIGVVFAVTYSKIMKSYFFTKNVIVAFSLSLAVIAGAVAVNGRTSIELILVLALVFVMAYSFEVHKDLGDIAGDAKYNIKTIPTQLGITPTLIIIFVGYTLGWVLAISVAFFKSATLFYHIVLASAALFGIIMVFFLKKDVERFIEPTRIGVTVFFGLAIISLSEIFLK